MAVKKILPCYRHHCIKQTYHMFNIKALSNYTLPPNNSTPSALFHATILPHYHIFNLAALCKNITRNSPMFNIRVVPTLHHWALITCLTSG